MYHLLGTFTNIVPSILGSFIFPKKVYPLSVYGEGVVQKEEHVVSKLLLSCFPYGDIHRRKSDRGDGKSYFEHKKIASPNVRGGYIKYHSLDGDGDGVVACFLRMDRTILSASSFVVGVSTLKEAKCGEECVVKVQCRFGVRNSSLHPSGVMSSHLTKISCVIVSSFCFVLGKENCPGK